MGQGSRVLCEKGWFSRISRKKGDPSASAAGAVYGPPRSGRPPTLTFQGSCRLHGGDSVSLGVICAG